VRIDGEGERRCKKREGEREGRGSAWAENNKGGGNSQSQTRREGTCEKEKGVRKNQRGGGGGEKKRVVLKRNKRKERGHECSLEM